MYVPKYNVYIILEKVPIEHLSTNLKIERNSGTKRKKKRFTSSYLKKKNERIVTHYRKE